MFISFDAIAVSGIKVEAAKLAFYLNNRGFESFIDLGYDIKIDKGNFAKPYSCYEKSIFDKHFNLVRINDIHLLKNYTTEFIDKINNTLIKGTTKANLKEKNRLLEQVDIVADQLSELIFNIWNKLEITHLVIENGTLPENIIYTKALYKSIEKYGTQKNLACFVLWRDHDLMWNSETLSKKYGQEPWYYAIKPIKSKYIKYVTLNNSLAKKLKDWSKQDINIDIMRNTYLFNNNHDRINIRDRFNISKDDFLIARTTRIIPEKKLERDIYLIKKLNELYIKNNKSNYIYLIIAGDEKENSDYSHYLRKYIKKLELDSFIKFSGPLQHDFIENENNKPTIQDLYYSSDMV
ncbi:glycosyl transferase family 2 [Arsenophonus apicola]|uniref:glycosyl transferase family 2 n=1 Tax=Arsenophonus apicola TaxID=2879119 RepID=UPI00387A3495